MTERCVDANVAIKWVIATECEREKALALLKDSIYSGITLIAPPLFPVEVDSIIRKRVHNGSLTLDEGIQAYTQLDAVPVRIVDLPGLRRRAREIAARFNHRLVYDSLYAALADLRQCELWTADTRFHRVVNADLPFVRHIADPYPAYGFGAWFFSARTAIWCTTPGRTRTGNYVRRYVAGIDKHAFRLNPQSLESTTQDLSQTEVVLSQTYLYPNHRS